MEPCSVAQVATYYLSQTDIARELGISRTTVASMRERYPGFPGPDAWIGAGDGIPGEGADPRENPQENGKSTPGWLPERLEEIRRFRAEAMPGPGARTDLA